MGFLHSGHEHDVARDRLFHRDPLQAAEAHDLADLGLHGFLVCVQHKNFLRRPELAAADAPDADASHVARIVEVADLQLQRSVRISAGRRDAFDDRVEQRLHVVAGAGHIERCRAE